MADVFISYSVKDELFVRQLHEALKGLKRDTWIDWRSIPDSAKWKSEILIGIDEADNFLFVISPDSIESPMCREEIAHAAASNKRLIAILYRPVGSKTLPAPLAEIQSIPYHTLGFDSSFARLINAIDTDLTWVRAHTRLLVRAKEWDARGRNDSFLLRGMDLQDAVQWLAQAPKIRNQQPSDLHRAYIQASGVWESEELRRLQVLYEDAERQRKEAERQRQIAVARQLAAQASQVTAEQPSAELSVLLAVESMQRAVLFENDLALRNALDLLPRTLRILRHNENVHCVAFSPDEKYLATGTYDKTAQVFEVSTGKELCRFDHSHSVHAVAFSPDACLLATGSADKAARVFDVLSGRLVTRVDHEDTVLAVTFSPNGQYVATGSVDRKARVFNSLSGQIRSTVDHNGSVFDVAFSRDSRYLASVSAREILDRPRMGELLIFNVPKRRIAWRADGGAMFAVTFSPDGRYLAVGAYDHLAEVVEIGTWQRRKLPHRDSVNAVAFSSDGRYLATGCGDRKARVFEPETGREVAVLNHQGYVVDVAFSPNGRFLATASHDNTARVLEVSTGREISRIEHGSHVNAVAFCSNSRYVATASLDRTAKVVEIVDPGRLSSLSHRVSASFVSLTPDGRHIATASDAIRVFETTGREISNPTCPLPHRSLVLSPDARYLVSLALGTASIVEVESGREVQSMSNLTWAKAVDFSADGRYLAFSGGRRFRPLSREQLDNFEELQNMSGETIIFEVATGHEIKSLYTLSEAEMVALSPDGGFVAIADTHTFGFAGRVTVFEIATGTALVELGDHLKPIRALVFGPNGRHVAVVSESNTGRVFEVDTGRELLQANHQDRVLAVALSCDGRYTATAGDDNTAKVFDMASGREVSRLNHAFGVRALAFSDDGRYLTVASESPNTHDIVITRHILRPNDLVAEACCRLARNLTLEEWHQYLPDEPYRRTC